MLLFQKLLFFIILCILPFAQKRQGAQNKNAHVTYMYEGKSTLKKDSLWLVFTDTFSDRFKITVGKKIISNRYFETNESIGLALPAICIPGKYIRDHLSIKIYNSTDKSIKPILTIPFKIGYSSVYIKRWLSGDWDVTYSNLEKQYE